jgi:hypothetical protein
MKLNQIQIHYIYQKILKKSEIKFNQINEHDQKIRIFYEGLKENEIKNFDKNLAKNFIKFSHYKRKYKK